MPQYKQVIPNRLGEIIEKKWGYGGASRFAEITKTPLPVVSRWINNRQSITTKKLPTIAEILGVSVDYLLLRTDEPTKDSYGAKTRRREYSVKFFTNTYASAGGGIINYQDVPELLKFDAEWIETQLGINCAKNIHIIRASGDSMSPTLNSDELLFVLPFENEGCHIANGSIYVVRVDNEYFVKRVEKNLKTGALTLKSDNKEYEAYTFESNECDRVMLIGRVVFHLDRV